MPPKTAKSATEGYAKTTRTDAAGRIIWKSKAGADRVRCKSTSGPAAGKLVWRKPAAQKPKPAAAKRRGGGPHDPLASVPQIMLDAVDLRTLENLRVQASKVMDLTERFKLGESRNGIVLIQKVGEMLNSVRNSAASTAPIVTRRGGGSKEDDMLSELIREIGKLDENGDETQLDGFLEEISGGGSTMSKRGEDEESPPVDSLQVTISMFDENIIRRNMPIDVRNKFGRSTLQALWTALCFLIYFLMAVGVLAGILPAMLVMVVVSIIIGVFDGPRQTGTNSYYND